MSGIALKIALDGASTFGFLVAALFFFRFWRRTKDFFFGLFGLAWAIMAVERIGILFGPFQMEPGLYLLRLSAFALIVTGIIQKNRRK